jgi:tRNA 2-selenouridine synthase
MELLTPQNFLFKAGHTVVVDVRSPAEYAAGHIPGAVNMPLFDDGERADVGTIYKQKGREKSILRGLELAGPKLADFVKAASKFSREKQLLLHCWRGGMRSANMAWLLELAGFHTSLLEGGYKAYRHFIREQLGCFHRLVIIGGKTGSGKTEVLGYIRNLGFQVLDLEAIAHHKGSAFGDLGQETQPTNEQFENNLYQALSGLNPAEVIFAEDESRGIGRVSIPDPFFRAIRSSEVIFLDVPKKERIKRLVNEYSVFSRGRLEAAISRITDKLGGLNYSLALEALAGNDYSTVTDILLNYYDKAYLKGLSLRNPGKVSYLRVERDDPGKNAVQVIELYREKLAGKFSQPANVSN